MYDTVQILECAPRSVGEGFLMVVVLLAQAGPGGFSTMLRIPSLEHHKLIDVNWKEEAASKARHMQARRCAHAPLDNAARLRTKGWSRSMIGAPPSISRTSFFALMVSSSSSAVWVKSEETTSASLAAALGLIRCLRFSIFG